MNYDLFNQPPDNYFTEIKVKTKNSLDDLAEIPGLKYIPEFLSKQEYDDLWSQIIKQPWLGDLKRRVQHYGWRYDYRTRNIDYSMYLGALPDWAQLISLKLYNEGHIGVIADQLIVNEYYPGQGIASHVDCEPCFGDTITSISLGSSLVMELCNLNSKRKKEALLEPRSLIIISGESRYKWTHGIPARKVDIFDNQKIERKLRISLTFRKVIVNSCDIPNRIAPLL